MILAKNMPNCVFAVLNVKRANILFGDQIKMRIVKTLHTSNIKTNSPGMRIQNQIVDASQRRPGLFCERVDERARLDGRLVPLRHVGLGFVAVGGGRERKRLLRDHEFCVTILDLCFCVDLGE